MKNENVMYYFLHVFTFMCVSVCVRLRNASFAERTQTRAAVLPRVLISQSAPSEFFTPRQEKIMKQLPSSARQLPDVSC